MKSNVNSSRTIFIVVSIAMTIGLIPLVNNSQQTAEALEFDISDFNCIAVVGNIGDNICSENNGETTNNIVNYNTYFDCTITAEQSNTLTSTQTATATNTGSGSTNQEQTAGVNEVQACNLISLPN